jgi:hypothetical protein
MIMILKRYLARRRLGPVVSALPRRLVRAFGAGEHYTFLQAKRAISDLRIGKSVERYAYAAACEYRELTKHNMALSAGDYGRLRAELQALFALRRADFTVRDLLAKRSDSHSPGMDSLGGGVNPGSGSADGSGGG